MEALLADIPTDPKAFQRWLTAQGCWTEWPSDLMTKAIRAGHSLIARGVAEWADYEFRKRVKADWSAFTTAYADHVGAK